MRRFTALAICLLFLACLTATTALAQSPHFKKGSTTATLQSDGTVLVCWTESGLGNNENINYTAAATTASADYQCVNGGGNCPSAANKQSSSGPVSASGTFASGKNGSIIACLVVTPPAAANVCPSSQTLTLLDVSYSGISVTDNTDGITSTASPSSLSATPFTCP